MTAPLDSKELRAAMGRFATGVTVVTAVHGETRWGMTANAFTSVSLDPPLLLVSVARTSSMFPVITEADAFAVNILADDQEHLSREFAHEGDFDRVGVEPERAVTGAPILPSVLAYADCSKYATYDGGDHVLILGRIEEVRILRPDDEPLVFFKGGYRALTVPSER